MLAWPFRKPVTNYARQQQRNIGRSNMVTDSLWEGLDIVARFSVFGNSLRVMATMRMSRLISICRRRALLRLQELRAVVVQKSEVV